MWTVERRRGTHYCIERSSSEVSHDLRLVYERERWWWHWRSSPQVSTLKRTSSLITVMMLSSMAKRSPSFSTTVKQQALGATYSSYLY
jgi:hypothetical protein